MNSPRQSRDPEELEAQGLEAPPTIPSQTRLGAVHLTVAELERSIAFYRSTVGLDLLDVERKRAVLGAGEQPLVVLVEEPRATSGAGYTGLYHLALLVPDRADLARWLVHAANDRVRLAGLSDHFVSLAIYLADLDGHGIEIYWDRPRELWENQVAARMTTLPLDVEELLRALPESPVEPFPGLPPQTVIGHVHLKVAEVADSVAFYRDLLGFGLMASLGREAAFLSAGGYHHHIGLNTWESRGASPPPPGAAALRHATIVLPGERERERVLARLPAESLAAEHADGPLVRDPSGNGLVLALADDRS